MSDQHDSPQMAGDILIRDASIICANGKVIDLESFFVEMNIVEDIFSNALYGNIMLSDSLNIIEAGPIIGEEYLRVDLVTPSMDTAISKTFRIYSISERVTVLDDKTQVFTLHFCSPEVFVDAMGKIYKTFSGKISDVAGDIYTNYLQTCRNIVVNDTGHAQESDDSTNMTILDDTENSVKFTSPGWGAMKSLSWLAAKSRSAEFKSSDYLFFESSQQFYFGSISSLIAGYKKAGLVAAEFQYSQSNIRQTHKNKVAVNGVQYTPPNMAREYNIVESYSVVENFNTLKNTNDGFYASQMLSVNLTTKKFKYNNFDYVKDFSKFTHAEDYPQFTTGQFRNPQSKLIMNIQQTGLYSGAKANVNEYAPLVSQNRLSLLKGLSNTIVEATVAGRTNFEVGCLVYFEAPKLGPKDGEDITVEVKDAYLSGLYLVTCVRHKITPKKHMMNLELAKESVGVEIK